MTQHVKNHVMTKFGMKQKKFHIVLMKKNVEMDIIYSNLLINVLQVVLIHMKSKTKHVYMKKKMNNLKRRH